jgi:hypothetical protein
MNDYRESIVPFYIIICCGICGVLVDFFDGVAIITGGPAWLHKLDVFSSFIITIIICCLVAYSRI